jgi:hypothetical protein
MITRPTGMELRDWADQVTLDLDVYGPVSHITGDDWQGWGVQFLSFGSIGKNLPNPYNFTDWRDWAERMCQMSL